jgi:hypothetical protein
VNRLVEDLCDRRIILDLLADRLLQDDSHRFGHAFLKLKVSSRMRFLTV